MKTIEIFDPAMCCPTGVCGPSVDPELTRVANAVFLLEKKGVNIQRYNLSNDTQAFVSNAVIQQLLDEKGSDALPAIVVDGKLEKEAVYPTNEELAQWTGVDEETLAVKPSPSHTLDINLNSLN